MSRNLGPAGSCVCAGLVPMSDPFGNICPNSMGSRARQTELVLRYPGRGGFRPGAGRPRKKDKDRTRVPHRARPEHAKRHPVHATLRVTKDVHPLRTKLKLRALKQALRGTHETRGDFRVVHFSLQGSHVHLIVEADNKRALWRGIRAVEVRIARRFNRRLERGPSADWAASHEPLRLSAHRQRRSPKRAGAAPQSRSDRVRVARRSRLRPRPG